MRREVSGRVNRLESAPFRLALRDLFERVDTESFADIGVKVIWTDDYSGVPKRILEICEIDQSSANLLNDRELICATLVYEPEATIGVLSSRAAGGPATSSARMIGAQRAQPVPAAA